MGLFSTTIKDILSWEGREMVDKINRAQENKDYQVRSEATNALIRLVQKWEKAHDINKIVSLMKIEQTEIKKAVIKSLGNFRIYDAVNYFINQLNNSNQSIREEAKEAILKLGPKTEKTLIETWNEIKLSEKREFGTVMNAFQFNGEVWLDKETFQRVPDNLFKTEQFKQAQDYIYKQLRYIKISIVEILGALNLYEIPVCLLNAMEEVSDEEVAIAAIKSIGNSKYFTVIYKLKEEQIKNSSYRINDALKNSISKLESQKALEKNIAIDSLHEDVFKKAIASEDISVLLRILRNVSNLYQVEKAIIALGDLKASESVESLIILLKQSKKLEINREAAISLGKIGDKRAVDILIQSLDSKEISGKAAEALGKIGDKKAISALLSALNKESGSLAEIIITSLVMLQEFDGLESLMSNCGDEMKKIKIARAISKNSDKAVATLKNLVFDLRIEIMVNSAKALADIEKADYQVIDILQKALNKDLSLSSKNEVAECIIYIAQKDFNLVRQDWGNIKSYISRNPHHDNRTYSSSDCPSDSGVHSDSGIFKIQIPSNLK
jgi:HEAT repeat protein